MIGNETRSGSSEINDAVRMRINYSTTGLRGGDAGHGGKTTVELENLSAHFDSEVDGRQLKAQSVTFSCHGDAEGRGLVRGFAEIVEGLASLLGVRNEWGR